jgi:uncharacterized protein YcbK (DUF882 family)
MYNTRNFKLSDVIHRTQDFPKELEPVAYIAMGYVQALRDALWEHYGKEIRINITSGYRSPAYNATVSTAKGSVSHHVWRIENGRLFWAIDIASPDLGAAELYQFVKDRVRGEVYLHRRLGFVHLAPGQLQDEEFTI